MRRLAHANRVDTGVLVRHLGEHYQHGVLVHTHDLLLNRAALARLAVLSGYPEAMLPTVLAIRRYAYRDGSEPSRSWDPLGLKNPALVRPCSRCAARHGARIPAIVRLDGDDLPLCLRHRRTLVPFRDLGGHEQSLDATPEILTAARRYRVLRRRRRRSVEDALATGARIISGWASWRGQRRGHDDPISTRWIDRGRQLPGVAKEIVRYPETVALATMFARMPGLLHTPRGEPGDPSPMLFLLQAARYLDHPEPAQLLRWRHPLFRWADAPDKPSWWWRNQGEPDRTIYAALHAGRLPTVGPPDQIH